MIAAARRALSAILRIGGQGAIKERMSTLYLYASEFLAHYWALLTAGSLFGIKEISENYWTAPSERVKFIVDKIPDIVKKHYATFLISALIFYAGFEAWSDEHKARMEAEEKLSHKIDSTTARLKFQRIEITPSDLKMENRSVYLAHIWFKNFGNAESFPKLYSNMIFISDKILSVKEEEDDFGTLKMWIKLNYEIEASEDFWIISSTVIWDEDWLKFSTRSSTKYLYVMGRIKYKTDNSDNISLISDSCVYYIRGDINNYYFCASGHNDIKPIN